MPFRREPEGSAASSTEPPFNPSSWSGALIVMLGFLAVLWIVQIFNARADYAWNRFGLQPRTVSGLWGVLTQPFLHESWRHLASNSLPVLGIGWVLLLSGIRVWAFVTAVVIVFGDLLTWLIGPSHSIIVGASGLVFGWMGYLIARAFFSRKFAWIVSAVAVLLFFGTLLGSLLPSVNADVSWQSHACCFAVGIGVGWLLHPRHGVRRPRPGRPAVP